MTLIMQRFEFFGGACAGGISQDIISPHAPASQLAVAAEAEARRVEYHCLSICHCSMIFVNIGKSPDIISASRHADSRLERITTIILSPRA